MKHLSISIIIILLIAYSCSNSNQKDKLIYKNDTSLVMNYIFGTYDSISKQSIWYTKDTSILTVFGSTGKIKLTSKLLSINKISQSGKDFLYVITENFINQNQCHSCAPLLRFSLFEINDLNILTFKYSSNIEQYGSWGESSRFEFIKMGPQSYGYLFFPGFTSAGITNEDLVMYALINGKLTKLLNIENVYMDNLGDCDSTQGNCFTYNYEYYFHPELPRKILYDFELIRKGTLFQNNKLQLINDTAIYKYIDNRYIKILTFSQNHK